MNNDDITMRYGSVENAANKIHECANKIQTIFDEVAGSVKIMTDAENFEGVASETLSNEFEPFRAQFADYVSAVRRFANLYTSAKEETQASDQRVAQKAEDLRSGGQR